LKKLGTYVGCSLRQEQVILGTLMGDADIAHKGHNIIRPYMRRKIVGGE